jgi:hypothetical protein
MKYGMRGCPKGMLQHEPVWRHEWHELEISVVAAVKK